MEGGFRRSTCIRELTAYVSINGSACRREGQFTRLLAARLAMVEAEKGDWRMVSWSE
jgi:hypothetical protein